MRYRIDGVLYEMVPPPKHLGPAITSRVKVMANLDIAERRLPQDGRIELTVGGNPVDLRVAVLPTMFGESVRHACARPLERRARLDRIGSSRGRPGEVPPLITRAQRHRHRHRARPARARRPRSTRRCSRAQRHRDQDPHRRGSGRVRHRRPLPVPGQQRGRADLRPLLRSFLRQDPDVILVGEIRDLETAQIAVQASLTGHLVLSTLHTNDAPSSIIRLVDLGLEPFLLAATIEGIVAQRLVRTIDPKSRKEAVRADRGGAHGARAHARRRARGDQFYRGIATEENNHSGGYKGRMALFEIMEMDDEMRELVMKEASLNGGQRLRAQARDAERCVRPASWPFMRG